jgi:hypothetical protein
MDHERLGLVVVDQEVHNLWTTTSKLELPEEMPSVGEAIKYIMCYSEGLEKLAWTGKVLGCVASFQA